MNPTHPSDPYSGPETAEPSATTSAEALLASLRCDSASCAEHSCLYGWHLPVRPGSVSAYSGWDDNPRRLAMVAQTIVGLTYGRCGPDMAADAASAYANIDLTERMFAGGDVSSNLTDAITTIREALDAAVRSLLGDHVWRTLTAPRTVQLAGGSLCGIEVSPYGYSGAQPTTPVDKHVVGLLRNENMGTMWSRYLHFLGKGDIAAVHRETLSITGTDAGWPGAAEAAIDLVTAWDAAVGSTITAWEDADWHLWSAPEPNAGNGGWVSAKISEHAIAPGLYLLPGIVDAWLRRTHTGTTGFGHLAAGGETAMRRLASAVKILVGDGLSLVDAVEAAALIEHA